MHKKVTLGVASAMFVIVGFLALILTDLKDHAYPIAASTSATVDLGYTQSDLSGGPALAALTSVSSSADLGLVRVKVSSDPSRPGEVLIPLEGTDGWPERVARFSDARGSMTLAPTSLAHSAPSSTYLITGANPRLDELTRWAQEHHVSIRLTRASSFDGIGALIRNRAYLSGFLAILSLLVGLSLFWLAVRARGRAIRVLAGVPARRIQAEDLGNLALILAAAAIGVGLAFGTGVGIAASPLFVGPFLVTYGLLALLSLTLAFGMTLLLSRSAWPTERSLADRTPSLERLGLASTTVRLTVLVVALLAITPAVTTWETSQALAKELAQWQRLSSAVALVYRDVTDADMTAASADVDHLVERAEAEGNAAMSLTFTPESGARTGAYEAISLVDQRWIETMSGSSDAAAGLTEIPADRVPAAVRDDFVPQLDVMAVGGRGDDVWREARFYEFSGQPGFPILNGASLIFPTRSLLVVLPRIHSVLTPDNITSLTSSGNILFLDADKTDSDLAASPLAGTLDYERVAENGLLQAHFAKYDALMSAIAVAGLLIAMSVAAGVGAFIGAITTAKRDFAARLAGSRWSRVIAVRAGREAAVAMVAAAAIAAAGLSRPLPALLVALLALAVAYLANLVATRWVFTRVLRRVI